MSQSIPCDVFVALQPNGPTIFSKNSHRPQNEVQEIFYGKGGQTNASNLKCTHIEIDNVNNTNSVILSKPGWMWGAEMGSNDKNVCIGNIGIKSRYNEGDADTSVKRLLGMDLVRLGLERGSSAEECLDIIVNLLETYGQGGPCTESESNINYQNAFIIMDIKNVWLLETCGKFWAAMKITSSKHFGNNYIIESNIDKMSQNLKEKTIELQLWDGTGEFNFKKCFSTGDDAVDDADNYFKEASNKVLTVSDMFTILRNKKYNICRDKGDTYPTQSSQVSCLYESVPSVHWFTGTVDPNISVYKPFVFTPNVSISHHIVSAANDPNHLHTLYNLHQKKFEGNLMDILKMLRDMENQCADEISEFLENFPDGSVALEELDDLMKDCIETEVKFYR